MRRLTDRQLLILIALCGEKQEALGLDPADDVRAQKVNEEGVRRWGDRVMSELADHVTFCHMSASDFVAWARESGEAWLREHVR